MVTTSYPRREDDPAGRFVYEMTAELASRGHSLTVAAPLGQKGADMGFLRLQNKIGIRFHNIVYPWPESWPGIFDGYGAPDALERRPWLICEVPMFLFALVRDSRRLLRNMDGLVSHWLFPSSIISALMFPGKPHVAVAHSSDVGMLVKSGCAHYAVKILLRSNTEIMFSCKSVRNLLMDKLSPHAADALRRRSFVQPMGVNIDTRLNHQRNQIRKDMGLKGFSILFMGRIAPVKQPYRLLDLAQKIQNGVFVVAGDGPLRQDMETRVQEMGMSSRFRFTGAVGPEKKHRLLAACDVLVSTSGKTGRTEGAPVSIMEASAAGLPVVAPDIGGIGELVQHEKTGFLFTPDNIDEMAEALKKLQTDKNLSKQMSVQAQEYGKRFDWSEVIAKVESRFQAMSLKIRR